MWLAQEDDDLNPVVRIFRLGGTERTVSGPEIQYNYGFMNLVVVSGNADVADQVDQALQLVTPPERSAIYVAVMRTTDRRTALEKVPRLRSGFGAVFLVDGELQEDTINRVVKMIITPGSEGHPWCFDWNDMISIVTGGSRTRPVRHGKGRASGPDAPTAAALGALHSLNVETEPFADNHLLHLVSLPRTAAGAKIKEVAKVIRGHLGDDTYYGHGVYLDDHMPADTVEVDIFDFGSEAETGTGISSS